VAWTNAITTRNRRDTKSWLEGGENPELMEPQFFWHDGVGVSINHDYRGEWEWFEGYRKKWCHVSISLRASRWANIGLNCESWWPWLAKEVSWKEQLFTGRPTVGRCKGVQNQRFDYVYDLARSLWNTILLMRGIYSHVGYYEVLWRSNFRFARPISYADVAI